MNNLKNIDKEIKTIRKFLFSKYQEYFEKTDWYCKSAEMATSIKLFVNDTKFISFNYNDFFELNNIDDVEKEIPKVFLNWLNRTLENKLLFLQFQTKTNISEELWNQILSYIYTQDEILNLYNEHKKYLKTFNFNNKKITEDEIIYSFYNEELFNIITEYLFIINILDINNLYNIDYINKEILKRKDFFDKIKDILNLKKFSYNIIPITNWEFKKYSIYIYSYVFWPYRNNNYFSVNFKELLDKINIEFNISWEFEIEEYNKEE